MFVSEKYLDLCNYTIYTRIVSSQKVKPSLSIVLIHGIGDHSGRYLEWMKQFEGSGVVWVTADLPGHGLSSGKRGYFKSLQLQFEIIEQLIFLSKNRFVGVPVVLYGHSMGGNICANFVIRNKPAINGLILTSPWLGLINSPPKWKLRLAEIASIFLKKMVLRTRIHRKQLTHNDEVLNNYEKDNLIHGKITLGTFLMLWNAMHYAHKNASKINIPTLLLHGTSDSITNLEDTKKFGMEIGHKAKFKSFDGMLHELHHDQNNTLVSQEIIKWFNNTFL